MIPRLVSAAVLIVTLGPVFLLAAPAALADHGGLHPRPELLVSSKWLRQHLQDGNLRIVDLRDLDDYRKYHIPGAVHYSADRLFSSQGGVEGMLPPAAQVAAELGRLGIGPDTVVVAYDDAKGLYAARLFWALDYIGQGNGRLLDGGWPRWLVQMMPVSSDPPAPPRAVELKADPRPELLADLAWMRAHLEHPDKVYVDARSTWEFRGITRYAKYRGHIPGAVSMEWKRSLLGNGRMRRPQDLRNIFQSRGILPGKEIAVYCQVLVRAAHSYFTLKWLGYPRVRGYDGSWAEWGNRDDTPKEVF